MSTISPSTSKKRNCGHFLSNISTKCTLAEIIHIIHSFHFLSLPSPPKTCSIYNSKSVLYNAFTSSHARTDSSSQKDACILLAGTIRSYRAYARHRVERSFTRCAWLARQEHTAHKPMLAYFGVLSGRMACYKSFFL